MVTAKVADKIVAEVRFKSVGKIYHFDASEHSGLDVGDHVIVKTRRGIQMAEVAKISASSKARKDGTKLKKILRLATPRDLVLKQTWEAKDPDAFVACKRIATELKPSGIKYHQAEYNFDGSRLSFFYTVTEDEYSGVGRMLSRLRKTFPDCSVDMVKIGPRDLAKLLGGIGACSGDLCCATFLTEFSPVTIKMAQAQGISLNPEDISGMCGRLRCCLQYEYEQYVDARKHLPKIKKRVGTPHGAGKVVGLKPLADIATVVVEGQQHDVRREDIVPWKEYEALAAKAGSPCERHTSGGCSCHTEKA